MSDTANVQPGPDDVEGHHFRGILQPQEDDVEGHRPIRGAASEEDRPEDDTEGHRWSGV